MGLTLRIVSSDKMGIAGQETGTGATVLTSNSQHHGQHEQKGGVSLVVQWLRLQALSTAGPGSISAQGTKPGISQLRVCMPR